MTKETVSVFTMGVAAFMTFIAAIQFHQQKKVDALFYILLAILCRLIAM